MLISVDAGKDTTKACIKNEGKFLTESFRSRIHDFSDSEVDGANDLSKTFIVEFKGNKYLVGDSGTKQEYTTSKTDIVNKLCQYVAITQFITPGEKKEIELVTGCPASIYKNKDLREEYIENIKDDNNIEITVDDKIYKFSFKDIIVRPEGSGILVLEPEWFKDSNVLVFDIGGQNLNVLVFDNFAIDPERMLTKNYGGITIEQNLINTFESLGIENITNKIIRNAIVRNKLKNNTIEEEKTSEIIKTEINKYIESNIIDELEKNGINHELYNKVFIGGTSIMIKEYLEKYFDDAIFLSSIKDSQFANSKGFYTMVEGV